MIQEIGNRAVDAATWDSLGYADHRLGGHEQASDRYRRALEMLREIGDVSIRPRPFTSLATRMQLQTTRTPPATTSRRSPRWSGHADAERIHEKRAGRRLDTRLSGGSF